VACGSEKELAIRAAFENVPEVAQYIFTLHRGQQR